MVTQALPRQEDCKIVQLIIFHVGDEEFGIPIGEVREIIKTGAVTPIPEAPGFIGGLINVRGDIVATIDLRARFSILAGDGSAPKHTVITRQGDSLFGLMVNEVTEVLRVPETDIKQAPELIKHSTEDYVHGVLAINGRLIILLDLARALSEQELSRWNEVKQRKEADENTQLSTSGETGSKSQALSVDLRVTPQRDSHSPCTTQSE